MSLIHKICLSFAFEISGGPFKITPPPLAVAFVLCATLLTFTSATRSSWYNVPTVPPVSVLTPVVNVPVLGSKVSCVRSADILL